MVTMAGCNQFRFKRFTIEQSDCAMKVGTDGVLLGAWCRLRPHKDEAILDIGAGTGVIALQLAQRTKSWNARIDAVEIDPVVAEQARRNFDASEWSNRLTLHTMPVQELAKIEDLCVDELGARVSVSASGAWYDHIVSNPPYFNDSLTSPDPTKTLARHTATLSYSELIEVCDRLLKHDGRISLILPAGAEADKMITTAATRNFVPTRLTEVHSTPRSGAKRVLIEFARRYEKAGHPRCSESDTEYRDKELCGTDSIRQPETTTLIIEDAPERTTSEADTESIGSRFSPAESRFSAEYRALTRDFYLYF